MVKLTLASGTALYTNESLNRVGMYINASNSGREAYMEAYKDEILSQKVMVHLWNVEYFEEI